MSGTNNAGIPYVAGGDPMGNYPALSQAIADAIAGPYVSVTGTVVAGAGWTINQARYRKVLGTLGWLVDVRVIRSGAAIAIGATGAVPGSPILFSAIPAAGPKPTSWQYIVDGWDITAQCRVGARFHTDGTLALVNGEGGATIATNDDVRIYGLVLNL